MHDYRAVEFVTQRVARQWNEYGGKDHGFSLIVSKERLRASCDKAHQILSPPRFPVPPGPFKRVAALLILGRLYPFFGLRPRPLSDEVHDQWLARVLAMLIPATLISLEVNLSTHGDTTRWVRLDHWSGFPSPHFKLEFITFVQWLDSYDWPSHVRNGTHELDTLARIILSTALIIEGCYYVAETKAKTTSGRIMGHCGACLPNTNMTSLNYDTRIYENWCAHKKRTIQRPPLVVSAAHS